MTLAEMKEILYNRIANPQHSTANSLDDTGLQCLYRSERVPTRSETNIACFIGELIPDNLYNPEIEEVGVINLLSSDLRKYIVPKELEVLPEQTLEDLFEDLQDIHDKYECDTWKDALDTWFNTVVEQIKRA